MQGNEGKESGEFETMWQARKQFVIGKKNSLLQHVIKANCSEESTLTSILSHAQSKICESPIW